jgi:hypothetical protein
MEFYERVIYERVRIISCKCKCEIRMDDPKSIKSGASELSGSVYFLNNLGQEIRPVYQLDTDTGKRSYRVYVDRGNQKSSDLDITCHRELAKHLLNGVPVRCKLPSGESSNRSLNSYDIVKLVVEK